MGNKEEINEQATCINKIWIIKNQLLIAREIIKIWKCTQTLDYEFIQSIILHDCAKTIKIRKCW